MPEDLAFVQHIQSFFSDHHNHNPHPPKPALSEHSTSNPASSSGHTRFHSPPVPPVYSSADPPMNAEEEEEEEEEEDEEEEDEGGESDSEAETGRNGRAMAVQNAHHHAIVAVPVPTTDQPSELMQLEMSEDIRLGSPDDASNNLDSDFHMLAVTQSGNPIVDHHHQRRADSYRGESAPRWPMLQEPTSSGIQIRPPSSGTSKTGSYLGFPTK